MNAYKFLGRGAVGLFSGFKWPTPAGDRPGEWIDVEGPLVAGSNGVHALRTSALVYWIDDELWVTELEGETTEADGIVLGRRARLVRRVPAWNEATARAFTQSCLESARASAARALPDLASRALATVPPTELQGQALGMRDREPGVEHDALTLLADAIELARGGRPEAYRDHPTGDAPASPGAIAANLGFVVAHIAGALAAGTSGDPGDYGDAYASERQRQCDWLCDRLGLDRAD